MRGFKEYINETHQYEKGLLQRLDERQQFGKSMLYPLGYGGLGNYPPSYMIPSQADAITYLTDDARLWSIWEKKPFPINQLKPGPVPHRELTLKGEIIPWKDTHKFLRGKMVGIDNKLPPGDIIPWKELKEQKKKKEVPTRITNLNSTRVQDSTRILKIYAKGNKSE